jgi:hypothetical protein
MSLIMRQNDLNKGKKTKSGITFNGRRFIYYGAFKKHLVKAIDEVIERIDAKERNINATA